MSLKDTYNTIRNKSEASGIQQAFWQVEAALDDFARTLAGRRTGFIGDIEAGVSDAEARKKLSDTRALPPFQVFMPSERAAFIAKIESLPAYRSLIELGRPDDLCFDISLRLNPSQGNELIIAVDPEKTSAETSIGYWGEKMPTPVAILLPAARKPA